MTSHDRYFYTRPSARIAALLLATVLAGCVTQGQPKDTDSDLPADPNALVFVVVGDAAKVKPQLAKLGLPVEEVPAR